AGEHATHDVEQVAAHAGLGLQGDRYFAVPAHYKAQATLIAAEVLEDVKAAVALETLDPVLTRRNSVVRGMALKQLVGKECVLAFGEHSIRFAGGPGWRPWAWMEAAVGGGARAIMRGRGGFRVLTLEDVVIRQGAAILRERVMLDIGGVTAPVARPKLPSG